MNEYLTKFAYKNAATEDLWASLSSASGKPVDTVMSTWTKKMGYPVLTVSAKQVIYVIVYHDCFTMFCANGNLSAISVTISLVYIASCLSLVVNLWPLSRLH